MLRLIFFNYLIFKNKVNVELSKENWSAKDNIVVSGYKIEVSPQKSANLILSK